MFQQLSWYSPGTTTTFLQRVHTTAAKKPSEKYELTWDQVTAEVLQKYLRERKIQAKKKNIIEREEQIVEYYEELNRLMWLLISRIIL